MGKNDVTSVPGGFPTVKLNPIERLPAPSTGAEEMQFRRFLLSCYRRVEEATTDEWKRDPVFHRYVEDLQNQLAKLRNSTSVNLSSEMVAEYVERVEHLSNGLLTPDIPPYCKKLPKSTASSHVGVRKMTSKAEPSTSETKPDVYRNFGRLVRGSKIGGEAKNTLEMHAQLQESMTDDLLKLARDLKRGTQAVQSALEKRDVAIESASDALDFSAVAAKEASKGAAKQYKMSRMGTCRMLLILLFVGFVFTTMVFFIRITSFVGYRAKQEL